MAIYNPKSMKAEEFISDAEIRDTLAYAEAHKNDLPLIRSILDKARPQKTATGHYILEMKGAGYGINGGDQYHQASGEYIVIRLSLTKEGKIIDCLTVSQGESKGFGDACADEKFYGQFDGKTESDYKNVDAITGATITTKGYMKAIERAFECVKILEGGSVNEE